MSKTGRSGDRDAVADTPSDTLRGDGSGASFDLIIVEGDPVTRRLLDRSFREFGCRVSSFSNGGGILRRIREIGPDVVLLGPRWAEDTDSLYEWILPRVSSALLVATMVQQGGDVPDGSPHRLRADVQLAADTPPEQLFDQVATLVAKRRSSSRQLLQLGELRVDSQLREVTLNGRSVHLQRDDFSILDFLAHCENFEASADELEQAARFGGSVKGRSVNAHLNALRKAFAEVGGTHRIIERSSDGGARLAIPYDAFNTGKEPRIPLVLSPQTGSSSVTSLQRSWVSKTARDLVASRSA